MSRSKSPMENEEAKEQPQEVEAPEEKMEVDSAAESANMNASAKPEQSLDAEMKFETDDKPGEAEGGKEEVNAESEAREEKRGQDEDEETCPLCSPHAKPPARKEDWVMCEACNTWYHWRPNKEHNVQGPFAQELAEEDVAGLCQLGRGASTDPRRFLKQMEGKRIRTSPFRKMKGEDVNLEWLEEDETAMTEPIVIETPEGLGMKMPDSEFTADDVASELGAEASVEVMDCGTQSNSSGWTLGRWADYMEATPEERKKGGKWGKGGVYNVISLEVSGTKVGEMVIPPKIVRDLDWVEKFWPSTRKGRGHVYPKVQLYCLMGVEGAWTDWHVDFAGSSVYYHILSGSKVFYFIRPTSANLDAYQKWSGSDLQNQTWLGDMVDAVYKVELKAGNTMIIPAGGYTL
ncbi:hypothetical protein NMY22_g13986 [Coprinellus aureogranulatus]|nr:hypothetical protein NMY22_g13986 [Coprinellus aureogranulatus]